MNNVFLEFCGIVIECRFEKFNSNDSNFINTISSKYNSFITKKRVTADKVIIFTHNWWKYTDSVFDKNKCFVELYKEKGRIITTYCTISLAQFEIILAHIMQKLLSKKDTLAFHGSAALVNGKANVFLGPSTAGKTTIAKLLSKKYQTLADDLFYIGRKRKKFTFLQIPLSDKIPILRTKKPYTLGNIYFLKKSTSCITVKIEDKSQIATLLLNQLFSNQKPDGKKLVLITNFINSRNSFYYLYFPKDEKTVLDYFKKEVGKTIVQK